jgi:hypothetical protein
MLRNMIYASQSRSLEKPETTYRGSDVNPITDTVDINVIMVIRSVVELRPVDPHGVLAAILQASVRLNPSWADEVVVHHHGTRGRGVRGSHDRHST